MKKIALYITGICISAQTFSQLSVVKANIYPYDFIQELNGKLLFFAADEASPYNYELWSSDGTEAGTAQVIDIDGSADGSILSNSYWGPQYGDRLPVNYNGEMYFIAYDATHGLEVWKTDGTAAGTTLLKDIHPGYQGFFDPEFNYPYFTEMGGLLYFAANDGVHGFELWKTDGTEAGTQMVKDISIDPLYGSNPEHLINFNGKLYFTARDDVYGYELYTSDGTTGGTMMVKDIVPGIGGSMNDGYAGSIDPQFKVSGNYLYFTARKDESLPIAFYLFRTDGTAGGTITLNNALSDVGNFCDVNGTCYFYGFDGDFSHSGLWKSDGTPGGTTMVTTNDGIMSTNLATSFYSFNNQLYFYGYSYDITQFGLARSDGTTAGTDILYSFEAVGSTPEIHNFNSDGTDPWFFYEALKKISETAMSIRLVQSNGTAAGNVVFPGVQPFHSTAFLGDDIYFSGVDSTADEVWGIYKVHPVTMELGTDQISASENINITPNPSTGIFNVQIPDNYQSGTLTVRNMLGEIILQKQFNTGVAQIQIDISNQPAGIFLADIKSGMNAFSQKLLKSTTN